MRPRKGSPADELGLKFTGNPDAIENRRKIPGDESEGRKEILDKPGKFLIGSLSGDDDK